MLTISVKNFGPIAEGSVDLKPLTIFVGPSNTGKSYMATAVYAVVQAVKEFTSDVVSPGTIQRFERRNPQPVEQFPDAQDYFDLLSEIKSLINHTLQSGEALSEVTYESLSSAARSWLIEKASQELVELLSLVMNELGQIHGGERAFVRNGIAHEKFLLTVGSSDPSSKVRFRFPTEGRSDVEFEVYEAKIPEQLLDFLNGHLKVEQGGTQNVEVHPSLFDWIWRAPFFGYPERAYYLPAGRTGLAQGYKLFSGALVRQSSLVGQQRESLVHFPRTVAQFLVYLLTVNLGKMQVRTPRLDKAISFIESDVLRGSISLDESEGSPFPDIAYETDAGKFTLNQTSSMVSELAPLVLFLKYLVRPGDLLILEEPESHLHPAAQRQLARGIVRLVNAGVKVLITTHSDLFVSQVNNLMRISFASSRWIRENGFEPQDCLKHDDVAAYLFRWDNEQGGSVVDELEIRRDVGIDDAMFGEVINEIYEESLLVQRIRPKWEQTNS